VDDLSILDDAERGTWRSKIIESIAHVVVDRIELGAGPRTPVCKGSNESELGRSAIQASRRAM
jgi:hypothetical protein